MPRSGVNPYFAPAITAIHIENQLIPSGVVNCRGAVWLGTLQRSSILRAPDFDT